MDDLGVPLLVVRRSEEDVLSESLVLKPRRLIGIGDSSSSRKRERGSGLLLEVHLSEESHEERGLSRSGLENVKGTEFQSAFLRSLPKQPALRTHRSLDQIDLSLLELEIVEMKFEVPDGLVSLLRVLEPSESSVLESDVLCVLRYGIDGSRDVSIDEFGLLEELVDTGESDDCNGERD